MEQIRGLVFHSRLSFIDTEMNSAQQKTFLNQLSEKNRVLLSDLIFPVNLYSFSLLAEIDAHLPEAVGQPEDVVFSKMGEQFAVIQLDRYFFDYINGRNPGGFLEHGERLYPALWHIGRCEVAAEKKGGTVKITTQEPLHSGYRQFWRAFLVSGLEICGAKKVKAIEADPSTDPVYSLSFNWQ